MIVIYDDYDYYFILLAFLLLVIAAELFRCRSDCMEQSTRPLPEYKPILKPLYTAIVYDGANGVSGCTTLAH